MYINGIKQTAIPKKGILFSVEQKQECEIVFWYSEQLLPYIYWIMYQLVTEHRRMKELLEKFQQEEG